MPGPDRRIDLTALTYIDVEQILHRSSIIWTDVQHTFNNFQCTCLRRNLRSILGCMKRMPTIISKMVSAVSKSNTWCFLFNNARCLILELCCRCWRRWQIQNKHEQIVGGWKRSREIVDCTCDGHVCWLAGAESENVACQFDFLCFLKFMGSVQ